MYFKLHIMKYFEIQHTFINGESRIVVSHYDTKNGLFLARTIRPVAL